MCICISSSIYTFIKLILKVKQLNVLILHRACSESKVNSTDEKPTVYICLHILILNYKRQGSGQVIHY